MAHGRVQVDLPGGSVVGLRKQDIFHARGIKYAECKRFEPPRLLEKWDSPIDATEPAPVCAQRPSRLSFVTGDIIKGRAMEEDCLRLTITAPAHALETKSELPTMVFLHGGAYLSGGGDLDCYYPGSLARRDIVVVNVTHRLGIFGYFPIKDTAPANLGLLDQIEAFRWVKKNISYFGGDPERVTAVGQSAGATTIVCMMVADGVEERLFQRAILQSPPFGWPDVPDDVSEQLSRKAKSLFKGDPRTATTEEALDVQLLLLRDAAQLGVTIFSWPRFGQYPLPSAVEMKRRIREAAPKYRILVSWVLDESVAFVPMLPSYPSWSGIPLISPLLKYVMAWWDSRVSFIWPSQRFHTEWLQAGGSSATICFRWRPQNSPLKAVHCLELSLLLGSWDAWKDSPMVHGPDAREIIERVGREVKDLWAAFVSGHVSAETLPSAHIDVDRDFSFHIQGSHAHDC